MPSLAATARLIEPPAFRGELPASIGAVRGRFDLRALDILELPGLSVAREQRLDFPSQRVISRAGIAQKRRPIVRGEGARRLIRAADLFPPFRRHLLRFDPGAVGAIAFGRYTAPDFRAHPGESIPPFATGTDVPAPIGTQTLYFNV